MSNPFGTWDSPISAASIASGVSLRDVQWNRRGDTLVWWENRGKTGVLQAQSGMQAPRDLTDSTLNVAGRVGYGGAAFTLGAGKAFFVANGRLYSQALAGGLPRPITPKFGSSCRACCFARWAIGWSSFTVTNMSMDSRSWTRKAKISRANWPTEPTSSCSRPGIRPGSILPSSPGIIRRCPGTAANCDCSQLAKDGSGTPSRRRYCDAGGRSRYSDLPARVLAGRALPGLRQRCQRLGANLPLRSCGKGTYPAYR